MIIKHLKWGMLLFLLRENFRSFVKLKLGEKSCRSEDVGFVEFDISYSNE